MSSVHGTWLYLIEMLISSSFEIVYYMLKDEEPNRIQFGSRVGRRYNSEELQYQNKYFFL